MSSWKALAWAKDQPAGTALAKVVLLLLAEKADERFSCYPSAATLAEEAEADVRSIRRILRVLEDRGLITTVARKRESGVCTSNRYFLNHPEAPHVLGVAAAYQEAPGGGHEVRVTLTPGQGHPDMRSPYDPDMRSPRINNPPEPPTDQRPDGRTSQAKYTAEQERSTGSRLLESLRDSEPRLRLSARDLAALEPFAAAALDQGWPSEALTAHLSREIPQHLVNPYGFLKSRLTDGLPPPSGPAKKRKPLPKLCGECDNRWVHTGNGKLARCPRCHPAAKREPAIDD